MSTHSGRVVHLRKEPFDERIDRHTVWGNPFVMGRDGTREEVIAKYHHWVITGIDQTARWIRSNVHTLHGKTLGCWCAHNSVTVEDTPWICHGQPLLELAAEAVTHGYPTEVLGGD